MSTGAAIGGLFGRELRQRFEEEALAYEVLQWRYQMGLSPTEEQAALIYRCWKIARSTDAGR
jgi:hypothetical protein